MIFLIGFLIQNDIFLTACTFFEKPKKSLPVGGVSLLCGFGFRCFWWFVFLATTFPALFGKSLWKKGIVKDIEISSLFCTNCKHYLPEKTCSKSLCAKGGIRIPFSLPRTLGGGVSPLG